MTTLRFPSLRSGQFTRLTSATEANPDEFVKVASDIPSYTASDEWPTPCWCKTLGILGCIVAVFVAFATVAQVDPLGVLRPSLGLPSYAEGLLFFSVAHHLDSWPGRTAPPPSPPFF